MDDSQFRRIFDHFGFSRAGYRKVRKGVKKRLARHMQETGCRSIEEYIDAVEEERQVRLAFERLMTVSISRFFRDRELWRIIQSRILPLLIKIPRAVKVWSAGCASGEEVYTFKIVWEAMGQTSASLPDLSILATDLCPEYLERARAAIYPESSMREVPEAIRSAWFKTLQGGKYALKSRIKEGISWLVHDLLSDPPGTAFDLIFLRNNLLTYYADEVKLPALIKTADALIPGGFLIIGSHEKMPVEAADLEDWEKAGHVFRKRQDNRREPGSSPASPC